VRRRRCVIFPPSRALAALREVVGTGGATSETADIGNPGTDGTFGRVRVISFARLEVVVGRNHPSALAIVAMSIAALSACSSEDRPKTARSTTTSTIPARPGADGSLAVGQLAPFTGPISTIAESFTAPVKLAVDQINFSGGVNGHPVTLTAADDESAVAPAEEALRKLVDVNRVDAVVGPSTSQLAMDLMDQARKAPVVMCSGSNTYGPITGAAARSGMYFRTAPPDRLQADALAQLVVAGGHRRPVVIAAPRDTYTMPLANATVKAFHARRIPAAALVTFSTGADPTAAVRRALQRNPDAVVLVGFPEPTAPVIRALVAAGKGPQQLPTYGSDGLQSGDLAALVDPANPAGVAGILGTTPAGAPTGIDHPFNAALFSVGVEPFFSATTYDCTILVALAAAAAHSDDPKKISEHFADNLSGKVDCSTYPDCLKALRQHRTIHYRGASSRFERWQRFEPGSGIFDIWLLGPEGRPGLGPPSAQISVSSTTR